MRSWFFVGALFAAAPGLAWAQACPPDGLIIETSIGTTIRAGGADPQDPSICLFRRTDGRAPFRSVYGFISADSGSLASAVRRAVQGVSPFQAGKKMAVDALQDYSSSAWRWEIEVLRQERVTVPAGTFDAWVVQITETGFGSNQHKSERSYWFDRASNAPVKLEVNLIRGITQLRSWEAKAVIRP